MKGNEAENTEVAAITFFCYQQVGPVRGEESGRKGEEALTNEGLPGREG